MGDTQVGLRTKSGGWWARARVEAAVLCWGWSEPASLAVRPRGSCAAKSGGSAAGTVCCGRSIKCPALELALGCLVRVWLGRDGGGGRWAGGSGTASTHAAADSGGCSQGLGGGLWRVWVVVVYTHGLREGCTPSRRSECRQSPRSVRRVLFCPPAAPQDPSYSRGSLAQSHRALKPVSLLRADIQSRGRIHAARVRPWCRPCSSAARALGRRRVPCPENAASSRLPDPPGRQAV